MRKLGHLSFHSHLSLVELLQKHRLSCASSTLVLDCSTHLWPRKPRGEGHRQALACRGSGTGGLQGGWRGYKRTWTVVPCPLPSQAVGVGNWGPGTEAATEELPLAVDKETGPQREPLPERCVSTEHAVASRRPDSGATYSFLPLGWSICLATFGHTSGLSLKNWRPLLEGCLPPLSFLAATTHWL